VGLLRVAGSGRDKGKAVGVRKKSFNLTGAGITRERPKGCDRKMKKKKFLTCAAFLFTLLFLFAPGPRDCAASVVFDFVRQWGYPDPSPPHPAPPARDPQGFRGPTDIAVSPLGIVYVADFSNSRIHKYDPDGNFLGMLTECPEINSATSDYCQDPGEAKNPISLAVDPLGSHVYVVDARGLRIQKFNDKGRYLLGWGFREAVPWLFKEPAGVAVDAEGDVYVTDIFQSIIVTFDSNGNFKTSLTAHCPNRGSCKPTDIATAPSGVYITDFLNNYVCKLDYDGNLKATWGSGRDGAEDGQFTYPAAVAVDTLGNIFVADTLNNRIQSFSGTWTSYKCSAQGGITKPFGIAVDAAENVYVSDTWNHRVLKYRYTMTTVVIDGCDSGVENKVLDNGSTMTSIIAQCAVPRAGHGSFVSCVTHLTNGWEKAGIITEAEAASITSCAEKSTIGR